MYWPPTVTVLSFGLYFPCIYDIYYRLLTVLSSCLIICTYMLNPMSCHHPNGFIAYMSFCDFIFGLISLLIYSFETQDEVCKGLTGYVETFVTEFSLSSSLFTYIVYLFNLFSTLHNPFINMKVRKHIIWILSVIPSLFISILFSITRSNKDFIGICWFVSGTSLHINFALVITLHFPVVSTVLLSIFVLRSCDRYFKKINKNDLVRNCNSLHYDTISYGNKLVISYSVYFLICGILYIVIMISNKGSFSLESASIPIIFCIYIFSLIFAMKGVFTLMVWVSGSMLLNTKDHLLTREMREFTVNLLITGIQKFSSKEDPLNDSKRSVKLEGDVSVTITEYKPKSFQRIREIVGESNSYYNSFDSDCIESITSNGNSGAYQFFSNNMKYIVKTMTSSEFNVLESILPDYIDHINNLNNIINYNDINSNSTTTQTKLTLFLGCYSYDTSGLFPGTYERYYFFVMNNLIINRKDYILYDLKGSYINRTNNFYNNNHCMRRCSCLLNEDFECDLKDNDYSERVAIKLKKDENTNPLYNILIEDSSFLMQHSLMDYSLLLAVKKQTDESISDNDKNNNNNSSSNNDDGNSNDGLVDVNGTEFSILIIDLFQKWDFKKKIENIYKIFVKRLDSNGISSVNPEVYHRRFVEKVINPLFSG